MKHQEFYQTMHVHHSEFYLAQNSFTCSLLVSPILHRVWLCQIDHEQDFIYNPKSYLSLKCEVMNQSPNLRRDMMNKSIFLGWKQNLLRRFWFTIDVKSFFPSSPCPYFARLESEENRHSLLFLVFTKQRDIHAKQRRKRD